MGVMTSWLWRTTASLATNTCVKTWVALCRGSWALARGPQHHYIRSHEYGRVETITDFDPTTDKINFLYYGTRERLSVTQDGAVGYFNRATGQTFIFKNTSLAGVPGPAWNSTSTRSSKTTSRSFGHQLTR